MIPVDEPPAQEFEIPEDPPQPPRRVRQRSLPDTAESSTSAPSYQSRNAFERFIVTNLTHQSDILAQQTEAIARQSESISQLTTQFQMTESQVDRIF